MTWSLAKQLYGPHGPYIWVPLALVFGMVPTIVQYFVAKVRTSVASSLALAGRPDRSTTWVWLEYPLKVPISIIQDAVSNQTPTADIDTMASCSIVLLLSRNGPSNPCFSCDVAQDGNGYSILGPI